MSLHETWQNMCNMAQTPDAQQAYWNEYFAMEKKNYEKILSDTSVKHSGTLCELATAFEMDEPVFVGFIDGINTSLTHEYDLDELTSESEISLDIDFEKLYFNMRDAKADWLFELPAWEGILSEERRREITKEWRLSKQAVSENTVGRNESCPCGSGKKYKKCCGK